MRIVRGAILPGLFFEAPVWAFILRYSMRLGELDGILALVARMALSLERLTSTKASLALVGLMPVRHHILRSLARYMLRKHRAQLVEGDLSLTPHWSDVTPFELGWAWFQHQVWGKTLTPTLPRH